MAKIDSPKYWSQYIMRDIVPLIDKFREMLEGNVLVELGVGSTPKKELWDYGPKEVILVEPTDRFCPIRDFVRYAEIDGERCDGLSYLEQEVEDDSVVIASFAFMDPVILCGDKYARELIGSIYRKTIPGGLTLHAIDDVADNDFSRSRFYKMFFRWRI